MAPRIAPLRNQSGCTLGCLAAVGSLGGGPCVGQALAAAAGNVRRANTWLSSHGSRAESSAVGLRRLLSALFEPGGCLRHPFVRGSLRRGGVSWLVLVGGRWTVGLRIEELEDGRDAVGCPGGFGVCC